MWPFPAIEPRLHQTWHRGRYCKQNAEIAYGHSTEQIWDNIDKSTSFSNNMQPTKKHAISLQGKIFGMSLTSRVCIRWHWRHKPDFSNRFCTKISYPIKAKDGIYKTQGTWNWATKLQNAKCENSNEVKYLQNERQGANSISTEMQEKTGRWAYASVNSTCTQQTLPPPSWADPRALALFLPWMANLRVWGLLSGQFPRGADKKRGQIPRPLPTLQHFLLIIQSNSAILICDFLLELTSPFVIALGF